MDASTNLSVYIRLVHSIHSVQDPGLPLPYRYYGSSSARTIIDSSIVYSRETGAADSLSGRDASDVAKAAWDANKTA